MKQKIDSRFLFSCVIVTLVGLQVVSSDVTDGKDPNSVNALQTRLEMMTADIGGYIQALKLFNPAEKNSFVNLTTSIKNLFENFDYKKQEEFAALLFVFPSYFKHIFPDQRFKTNYPDGYGEKIDVCIHRADGTFFILNQSYRGDAVFALESAVNIMRNMEEDELKRVRNRNLIQRDYRHKILVGLKYTKIGRGSSHFGRLSSSYLCDSFNISQAVNVTVTV